MKNWFVQVDRDGNHYADGVYGRQIGTERELADRRRQALQARVREARQYFVEAPLDDFDILERTPGRVIFVDKATQTEFRRGEFDPMAQVGQIGQSHLNLSCFVVDDAGAIHFLRKRGQGATPVSLVHHGPVTGRKIAPVMPSSSEGCIW
jgi:hypothetical protein